MAWILKAAARSYRSCIIKKLESGRCCLALGRSQAAIFIKSVMNTRTTSEQALYRLLRLFLKSQSALTPLLLLFSRDPLALGSRLMLRTVRIWIAIMH